MFLSRLFGSLFTIIDKKTEFYDKFSKFKSVLQVRVRFEMSVLQAIIVKKCTNISITCNCKFETNSKTCKKRAKIIANC